VVPRRTTRRFSLSCSNTGREPARIRGMTFMQSAQPRDIGVLILVIGMFLVLFVVSLTLGRPLG
jgi:hypothetical protein